MADLWTMDLERAFQELRERRGGEPFADANLEDAYLAAMRRRFRATPDAEVREAQLKEERGERE